MPLFGLRSFKLRIVSIVNDIVVMITGIDDDRYKQYVLTRHSSIKFKQELSYRNQIARQLRTQNVQGI